MSAETIVQRQLDTYNAQELEAFLACFADDCLLCDISGAVIQNGIGQIRARYAQLFAQYPKNRARIVNRIAVGDVVIDHEAISRAPGEEFEAIAIYTVRGGVIVRVNFARGEGGAGAEVVQRQIDAYNAHDVERMCACYTEDCVFAELNGEVRQQGRAAIQARYAQTFAQFPQNRAHAANRIALGAYVVDDEQGERAPGVDPFRVGAIYTIRDGLIARCDFVR
ncbi:MAG: SgcJ/EcaC family oxidoreductase [Hyphomonadaceae bacterium]